ncbi:MAG: CYTH domain-containing protein, partial [Gammaproteobacteria bacterium]
MAIEIERKFLLKDDSWRQQADAGTAYRQGYLIGAKQASVRVRIEGDKAFINIKSMTLGVSRLEYQYPIPVQDAEELLDTLCDKPLVEKTRYRIQHAGHEWEIDVFEGDNAGLVVAEVEHGQGDGVDVVRGLQVDIATPVAAGGEGAAGREVVGHSPDQPAQGGDQRQPIGRVARVAVGAVAAVGQH